MRIERFHKKIHNAESFSCGKRNMDDFLRLNGASDAYGNTYVLVDEDNENEIIAYYTIQPDPVELEEWDEDEAITYIVLERLAVSEKYQRQGYGRRILGILIQQIITASLSFKIDALLLTPLDDQAKEYYLALNAGFEELADGSYQLALAVSTMKKV